MAAHIPGHCEHKSTGRGFVRLGGKQVYTGRWGTAAAEARYKALVGEWLTTGQQRAAAGGPDATMLDLLDLWAQAPPTTAPFWKNLTRNVRQAMVKTGAGDLTPDRFGPKAAKLCRQVWIDRRLCRRMVNDHFLHLRALCRWAVGEELAPPSLLEGIRAVGSVRKGAPGVEDREPVRPVPEDALADTIGELGGQYADMVRVQLLTGMRPGEVCMMRPSLIERGGPIWHYRPGKHKNAWRDKTRCISIGPKAQAVLAPYLERATPAGPLFHAAGKNRPYSRVTYYNALVAAAERAGHLPWGPNRLRHNAATLIRDAYGLDAAQAVLGHGKAKMSELYAALNIAKADEVAKQIG